MTETRRIAAVTTCCVVAALTPFVAGFAGVVFGLIPLGFAIWLLSRSRWGLWARVLLSAIAVAATGALMIGVLILVTASSGD